MIRRSRNLTSTERLNVYANAYYARLLECLREEFPATLRALGSDAFDAFAVDYLQHHPSGSYTLADPGGKFPQYLADSRPADITASELEVSWPEFLIDLATTERVYSEVFDGPGMERGRMLQSSDLTSVTSEEMAEAVLEPAPCLRLLALRYTVHEYISGVQQGQEPEFPTAEPTWLVVSRRDYVVRRCAVSEAEYVLLSAIVSGSTLGAAIAAVSATTAMDSDQLAASLRDWFCRWAAAAWFSGIRIRRQEPA